MSNMKQWILRSCESFLLRRNLKRRTPQRFEPKLGIFQEIQAQVDGEVPKVRENRLPNSGPSLKIAIVSS